MSVQNVRAFFDGVESDTTLRDSIMVLHKKAQTDLDGAIADLVKIASAAGFKFTAEDYAKVRAEHKPVDAALSDEASLKAMDCCNSGWSCCNTKTL
jgi:predicted ribosomally synthesized peptide with nif11-like leader